MTTIVTTTPIRPQLLTNTRTSRTCFLCWKNVPAGEPILQLTRSTHVHPVCWEEHQAREDGRALDELCEVDLAVYGAKKRGAA